MLLVGLLSYTVWGPVFAKRTVLLNVIILASVVAAVTKSLAKEVISPYSYIATCIHSYTCACIYVHIAIHL